MIDTHCHLTAPQFDTDRDEVVKRAFDAGINKIVCVSDSLDDIGSCLRLAEEYAGIYATAGAHPHHAKKFDETADLEKIRKAAKNPKCRAIGEIGLDYHYMDSTKDVQKKMFRFQLELAKSLKLPAIVHCREAVEDIWSIVDEIDPGKMVLHCCTEEWEDVKKFIDRGYFLSFAGIVTYPKSDVVRDTVLNCPIDQLMFETDAPFLAPVPYRGKRNEPAYVIETAKAIADIKNMSFDELANKTTENALKFFGI